MGGGTHRHPGVVGVLAGAGGTRTLPGVSLWAEGVRAGRAGGGTGGTAPPGPRLTFSPWAPFSPCQRKAEMGIRVGPRCPPPTAGHRLGHPHPRHPPGPTGCPLEPGSPRCPSGPCEEEEGEETSWLDQVQGASGVALPILEGRTYRWPCDAAPWWSRGSRGTFGARRSLQRKDSRNGEHGAHRGLGDALLPWHLSLLPSPGVPAVRGGPGGRTGCWFLSVRGQRCPQSCHNPHRGAGRGVTPLLAGIGGCPITRGWAPQNPTPNPTHGGSGGSGAPGVSLGKAECVKATRATRHGTVTTQAPQNSPAVLAGRSPEVLAHPTGTDGQ